MKIIKEIFVATLIISMLSNPVYGLEWILSLEATITRDDDLRVDKIKLSRGTPTVFIPNQGIYEISLVDRRNNVLYKRNFPLIFMVLTDPPREVYKTQINYRLPYHKNAVRMLVKKGDKILLDFDFKELCNHNGICDKYEDFLSCPEDCPLNKEDGLCYNKFDGICDPDCGKGVDPDCPEGRQRFLEAMAMNPAYEKTEMGYYVKYLDGPEVNPTIEQLSRFIDNYPESAVLSHVLYKLGWKYFNAGEKGKARGIFRKFIDDSPNDERVNEVLGIIETTMGAVVISFLDDVAPKHVANFRKLAREGYYDGTTFHRVIPNFVIQGGDPLSKDDDRSNDGTGGPGYTVPAEIKSKHTRGAVAAARRGDQFNPERRSSGSQFYICLRDLPNLDGGGYTVFGQVIEGMDVVDKIANFPRDRRDNPKQKVVMESVSVGLLPEIISKWE